MITDNPTTYTSLKIGNRTKKIKDYVAGPPKLKDIETKIDEVPATSNTSKPEDKLWPPSSAATPMASARSSPTGPT